MLSNDYVLFFLTTFNGIVKRKWQLVFVPSGRSSHSSWQSMIQILIRATDDLNIYALKLDPNYLCQDEQSNQQLPSNFAWQHLPFQKNRTNATCGSANFSVRNLLPSHKTFQRSFYERTTVLVGPMVTPTNFTATPMHPPGILPSGSWHYRNYRTR